MQGENISTNNQGVGEGEQTEKTILITRSSTHPGKLGEYRWGRGGVGRERGEKKN